MLDPYRICYGSRSGYWRSRGFADSFRLVPCQRHRRRSRGRRNSRLPSDPGLHHQVRPGLGWPRVDSRHPRQLEGAVVRKTAPARRRCGLAVPSARLLRDAVGHGHVFRQREPPGDAARSGVPAEENTSRAVEFRIDEDAMTSNRSGPMATRRRALRHLPVRRLPAAEDGQHVHHLWRDRHQGRRSPYGCRDRILPGPLIEVTPDKEIVFDMWIEDTGPDPMRCRRFAPSISRRRSRHLSLSNRIDG